MSVQFVLRHCLPQAAIEEEPFHRWETEPEGAAWCVFHRDGGGFRLRFPGLVDFLVSGCGTHVEAIPCPDIDEHTVSHLYSNQAMPLALSQQGVSVVHASAVCVKGEAIAFCGRSGSGKSTLATYIALRGGELMTDDGLVIVPSAEGLQASPSHPTLRLWQDSFDALDVGASSPTAPVVYSEKLRIEATDAISYRTRVAPLRRIYFLEECSNVGGIEVGRVSQPDAVATLFRNSFLLAVDEPAALRDHFERNANIAATGICHRLAYPRTYAALSGVMAAVLQDLERSA